MNENLKTLTFVAAAGAVALVAWAVQPSATTTATEDYRNQPLYPEMKDPLKAADLEIVKYDETRGELLPFRVAEVERDGVTRWSIPSHENYPADAKDQVAQAAGGLLGLKIIDMVSDNEGDQREYGVVEPNANVIKLGATGVGDKVVMKDAAGKEMLALVIGKEVPDRPNLRYVRKVGEPQIYIVEAKTDRLSTKFENWIEPNLLQINTMDLKQLLIRDYAVDVINGTLNQRGRMTIDYDASGEPHWKIAQDERFAMDENNAAKDRWEPVKMTDDEEVNAAKLDELKTALDDLKIVDVSRKPAGLSADLTAAADLAKNQEAVQSLARKGFFVAKLGKQVELFSNEGEIRLLMRDGVEYVLRFGQIAGNSPKEKDDKEKAKDGEDNDPQSEGDGLNRYLFVMAEFNPDAIPKPAFDPLPEPKKENETAKPDDKKPEEKKADEPEAKPEEKADAKAEEKADEKPDEKALAAEREQVEKENKRKQEEYDRQIADGKKRVAELNARFADWYYVISDAVYKKIHLSRDEIVTKKQEKKDEDASGDTPPGAAPLDHADHDHSAEDKTDAGEPEAKAEPATPVEELDKLKQEGPDTK